MPQKRPVAQNTSWVPNRKPKPKKTTQLLHQEAAQNTEGFGLEKFEPLVPPRNWLTNHWEGNKYGGSNWEATTKPQMRWSELAMG